MSLETLREEGLKWVELNKSKRFSGITKLLTDLYPDNAHFIYELLQNAEDAHDPCVEGSKGATHVKFELRSDSLIFEHNGDRLFSLKDVESISGIGDSSKIDDATTIGKFGIGFKAVFAYTDTPEIHSGDFHFRIHDLVVPVTNGVSRLDLGGNLTRFIFPLGTHKKTTAQAVKEIENGLRALDDNTLLFLNHIRRIDYQLPDGTGFITRKDHDEQHIEISSSHPGNIESISHWLRFQKEVNILDDGDTSKSCRIAIAYGIEPGDEKKDKTPWKIVPLKHGQVSIYFPAEKETSNLRFHMHAPFASTVARDSVRSCKANDNLRDELAGLVCESLTTIRDAGMLTVNSLATLPVPSDNLPAFYEPIRNHIIGCFRTQSLTPAKNGGHFPGEIMMRGPAKISEMLNDEDLTVIVEQEDVKWVVNPPQINQRIDQFLTSLSIDHWGWEQLEDYLYTDMSDFLGLKECTWLKNFYLFLHDAMVRQDVSGSLCSGWEILRSTEGNYLAGKDYFFPSSVHASDQISFLPDELLEYTPESKQLTLREFYQRIGVRLLGEREEIELILKEYYQTNNFLVSHEMHLNHIERIINYWKSNGNDIFPILKSTRFLLNASETLLCLPKSLYLDNPYKDTGLEAMFDDGANKLEKSKMPLWHGYAEIPNFLEFAQGVGVMSSLEILIYNATLMQPGIFGRKGNHTSTTINKDYFINGAHWSTKNSDYYLGTINLLSKSHSLSLAIWKTVSNSKPEYLLAHYRPNDKRQHEEKKSISFFLVQLKESAWIPDKEGHFCKPADMLVSTLHPDFVFNNANGWLTAIGFGENEAKKTEEYKQKARILAETVGLSPEEAADLKELLKDLTPEKRREIIDRMKAERMTENEPKLPSSPAPNPERREIKSKEAALDAKDKEYEFKNRSVRTTNSPERKTYLKAHNSTENGHIYCQLCNCRMPFMVKNEDYFEAVEFVRSSRKEHPENSLALCPNCAAEYKHACSTTESERIDLLMGIDINLPEDEMKISLDLPNHTSLRFTHKHLIDLRAAMLLHRETGASEPETDDLEREEFEEDSDDMQVSPDTLLPPINQPTQEIREEIKNEIRPQATSIVPTNIPDKRVERAIAGLSKATSNQNSHIISKVTEILRDMLNHSEFIDLLRSEGIHLTTLKQATDYLTPDLNLKNFGYSKYADFIQHVCMVSGFASLYTKPPSEIRLNRNNISIPGYTQLGRPAPLAIPPSPVKPSTSQRPDYKNSSALTNKNGIIIRKASSNSTNNR
jgi:hypothetical protein